VHNGQKIEMNVQPSEKVISQLNLHAE
jgi:hypothetical protein